MNNTVRMNNGAMVLNYTDATSILQYTLERYKISTSSYWANMVSLWGPIWFHYGGQWPILISCILSSFIPLVKAYILGLSIFFHSLMKFFIDGKKMNYLLQIFFFLLIYILVLKKFWWWWVERYHGCEVLTVMV